ncbi:MAG: hypothetical protein ABI137_01230 [Antricoccus sp.]
MDFFTVIEPIWKVLAVGLLLGAGLPALFALGVRFLDIGRVPATVDGHTRVGTTSVAKIAAGSCFLVVALVIALGLAVLIDSKAVLPAIGLG